MQESNGYAFLEEMFLIRGYVIYGGGGSYTRVVSYMGVCLIRACVFCAVVFYKGVFYMGVCLISVCVCVCVCVLQVGVS